MTPRTDAVAWRLPGHFTPNEHVPADFARELELELGIVSQASSEPLWKRVKAYERFAIEMTLKKTGGNHLLAAKELGIARATLYRKLYEKSGSVV